MAAAPGATQAATAPSSGPGCQRGCRHGALVAANAATPVQTVATAARMSAARRAMRPASQGASEVCRRSVVDVATASRVTASRPTVTAASTAPPAAWISRNGTIRLPAGVRRRGRAAGRAKRRSATATTASATARAACMSRSAGERRMSGARADLYTSGANRRPRPGSGALATCSSRAAAPKPAAARQELPRTCRAVPLRGMRRSTASAPSTIPSATNSRVRLETVRRQRMRVMRMSTTATDASSSGSPCGDRRSKLRAPSGRESIRTTSWPAGRSATSAIGVGRRNVPAAVPVIPSAGDRTTSAATDPMRRGGLASANASSNGSM